MIQFLIDQDVGAEVVLNQLLIIVTEGQGDQLFHTSCQLYNIFPPFIYSIGSTSLDL